MKLPVIPPCPDCKGTGYATKDPNDYRACPACSGTGHRRKGTT